MPDSAFSRSKIEELHLLAVHSLADRAYLDGVDQPVLEQRLNELGVDFLGSFAAAAVLDELADTDLFDGNEWHFSLISFLMDAPVAFPMIRVILSPCAGTWG